MAQGLGLSLKEKPRVKEANDEKKVSGKSVRKNVEGRAMGSRRIFAPHFKLKVLDSYRQDSDCRGNQRATARKYGIHRRQIQKWLQVEASLRTSVETASPSSVSELTALNLSAGVDDARQHGDTGSGESRLSQQHTEEEATCQHRQGDSSSVLTKEEEIDQTPSLPPVEDESTFKREVTVSLFPSVKIEQLVIKNEPKINLLLEQRDLNFSPYTAVKIENPLDILEMEVKEEQGSSEDENEMETEHALDFTCAALSKRRSFSLQFKLEVLNAFHSDEQCHGNQRATARKFGINRRQVQKWLHQELELRGETVTRGGLYRQRLGRWAETEDSKPAQEIVETNCALDLIKQKSDLCWDLSNRKRKSVNISVIPFKKRTVELLLKQQQDKDNVSSSGEPTLPCVQETALCLVKEKPPPLDQEILTVDDRPSSRNSEVSSSVDLNRVIGQALYHSNRDRIIPPYPSYLPLPNPGCFPPEVGFHHMLNFYRGFLSENIYPLDFKLQALDCYHSDRFCQGNQFAVASRFGIEQMDIQKWLKQEDQLRQHTIYS